MKLYFRNFCQAICIRVIFVIGENLKSLAPLFLDLWLIIDYSFISNFVVITQFLFSFSITIENTKKITLFTVQNK